MDNYINKVIQGDCLEKLKDIADNSVDSIVTDPPYELGFMGKSWDNTGIANNIEMWAECLRVLKPGGHLLAFSGTRTYHRMASAIEDAGFEVRDMIEWVYGSGFPKSHNIGKNIEKIKVGGIKNLKQIGTKKGIKVETGTQGFSYSKEYVAGKSMGGKQISGDIPVYEINNEWEGWGTALKPAHEPICMARKPLAEKTVAENVLKYGTGGINIDESRVDYQSEADKASATPQGKCTSNTSAGSAPDVDMSEVDYNGERYWYKNEYKWLVDKWLNDEDYVWSELKENLETYDWCKVPEIDGGDRVLFDSGESVCIRLYESKRKEFVRPEQLGRFPANLIHDNSEEVRECFPETKSGNLLPGHKRGDGTGNSLMGGGGVIEGFYGGDSGNASRFFKSIIYQAKASKSERNMGMDDIEAKEWKQENSPNPNREERPFLPVKNNHPTVKPIALMEYLIKMVTPKGGIVLDPFAGSGSTGIACKNTKRNYILIEKEQEYIDIINKRLTIKENENNG